MAKEAGVSRFFYSSSACVYAADKQTDPNVTALEEEDAYTALPEDGYGWEKLFSERMCRNFRDDFGIETRVARYQTSTDPTELMTAGARRRRPRSAGRWRRQSCPASTRSRSGATASRP